uniref:non-specific serine/threonine protein kinase n=1 Tax=Welwitschia mirabilis TaxID=3377 RepID=A0A059UJW9_WELMI|nr:phototropin [Welwitschia mirabilis]|eukprot:TRINITY_DN4522_c0_g1_i2.p1 TRINITY_DN4522_c0_g1~~TRINITY_DN4522_c0_g1_i2.p1  ORF type:complete len:1072 (+),score=241.57 TRINITY_DN4522_c0_g1_i2:335-3550(+)
MDSTKPEVSNSSFSSDNFFEKSSPSYPVVNPLPRDSRGSLEVFNPMGYSSGHSAHPITRGLTMQCAGDFFYEAGSSPNKKPAAREHEETISIDKEMKSFSNRFSQKDQRWMAFGENDSYSSKAILKGSKDSSILLDKAVSLKKQFQHLHECETGMTGNKNLKNAINLLPRKQFGIQKAPGILSMNLQNDCVENTECKEMEERAAEWGLILKTDDITGRPQGVSVRTSAESGKSLSSQRTSANSTRNSEDSDITDQKNMPHLAKNLKLALSAFQQTFVVADATKPDYPIMYASAGFSEMTGYSVNEVIGRNCRFLQGAETSLLEISNIREALVEGKNYCGRILNYKKDGTPFWNLLTIAPIKDETGNVLKFIGMQVEVSKHTEGRKDNIVRPNGLPESLIRYDARQRDMAKSSVMDLVLAVKERDSSSPEVSASLKSKGIANIFSGDSKDNKTQISKGIRTWQKSHTILREASSKVTADGEINKKRRKSLLKSLISFGEKIKHSRHNEPEQIINIGGGGSDENPYENLDALERKREARHGLDLATTLERIEKNFVITDPRLPDNPIIFASDSFLELTEYSREEILGRNCRFLQGPETDPATVTQIREAIENKKEITVQLLNYTKSGKKFWNLFHLQPMRDQQGEVQYFIGVQLDGTQYVEPHLNRLLENKAEENTRIVKGTATTVNEAMRELPDANMKPDDLWRNHSKVVCPKPHGKHSSAWKAIQKVLDSGEQIGLRHVKPIKTLGHGDTGSVFLVQLNDTGERFAMKTMDKSMLLNRNKVHRACAERDILDILDHPFLPTLYASFQTKTHICLITDYCPGGELFTLLDQQPTKVINEEAARFYAAEVTIALEYLHCQGIIYRDLKPENLLIQKDGHLQLTDFDLSCLTCCKLQVLMLECHDEKKRSKRSNQSLMFIAEPIRASNSFVGTEEYIAPEIISGSGHSSAVDWWALGILLYEMLYGFTPFRGKTRQKTFTNILYKELKFPSSNSVSTCAIQLIHKLLHKDPQTRLGSLNGANEIKQHPFFKDVNWALIRTEKPPQLTAAVPLNGEVEDTRDVFTTWKDKEALAT